MARSDMSDAKIPQYVDGVVGVEEGTLWSDVRYETDARGTHIALRFLQILVKGIHLLFFQVEN